MVRHSPAGKAAGFLLDLWPSKRSAQAGGPLIGLPSHKPKTKLRRNWKKEFKAERNKVIDEAISAITKKQRDVPEVWRRGYSSAITTLELMKKEFL